MPRVFEINVALIYDGRKPPEPRFKYFLRFNSSIVIIQSVRDS
jgi:hypothetical protein